MEIEVRTLVRHQETFEKWIGEEHGFDFTLIGVEDGFVLYKTSKRGFRGPAFDEPI